MKATGSVPEGIMAGVAAGAAAGALNGAITTLARMPSFIVTLGMMMVARGAALQVAGRVNVAGLPDSFGTLDHPLALGGAEGIGIPPVLIVFAVVAVGMAIVLRQMRVGRWAYAIGGNPEAARLAGIPVGAATTLFFALGGLLTGLAGVMLATRINVASPTAAQLYELNAIAAVVIGGASLLGGRGGVFGTVVGALIMAVLVNGLDLLGKPPDWQNIAIGGTIIVAVFLDHLRRRRRS
jgi:ribose transport system permease protein